jgi:hypothetical protein
MSQIDFLFKLYYYKSEEVKMHNLEAKISAELLNQIIKLNITQKLELIEMLIHQVKLNNAANQSSLTWDNLYGVAKNLWESDAQDYVSKLREFR